MDYDKVSTGNVMRKLRDAKNLSQQEVSDYLAISRSYYAGFETGTKQLSLDMALKIAAFYGVSLRKLIGWGDTPAAYGNEDVATYSNIPQPVQEKGGGGISQEAQEIIKAKDEVIEAQKAENQALRQIITLLEEKLAQMKAS